MPVIHIVLDAENAWPELREKLASGQLIHLDGSAVLQMGLLEGGMASGAPSVAIRFDLPDGQSVIAETSWAVLASAVRTLAARVGWPDDWPRDWCMS
jgi:hypothetical protein